MSQKRPFLVDGVEIPTPTTIHFTIEDLSSSATGRTLDGVMHKDVVAVKDTYECTWRDLTWGDAAHLLQMVNGKKSVQFTHPDPQRNGQFVTGQYYVGSREGEARTLKNGGFWSDITFSFIKV